jgi:hypothetical protein
MVVNIYPISGKIGMNAEIPEDTDEIQGNPI